jgi:hypothetical protein
MPGNSIDVLYGLRFNKPVPYFVQAAIGILMIVFSMLAGDNIGKQHERQIFLEAHIAISKPLVKEAFAFLHSKKYH